MNEFPRIRPLEFQPVEFEGEQMWLVSDPQRIADQQLLLPAVLAQMTVYCDGLHDLPAIYRRLAADIGFSLPPGTVENALARLDDAYFLDNERFLNRVSALRSAFLERPYRAMALAGLNYPADPENLAEQFAAYAHDDDEGEAAAWEAWTGRGVVSPHIDYQRGGSVYARTWRRAANAVAAADLVLMFATDHHGGPGSLTLTHKPYETPHGVLPTVPSLVDRLAAAIGEDDAYRLELNHRFENSVELSAVWLHHVAASRGSEPPPMVPLLIGSFQHFISNGHHPAQDPQISRFIETLRAETRGQKVLCVASVDLSHVGPAFGDPFTIDPFRRTAIRASDHRLISALAEGNNERWYDEIAAVQDRHKVCGFSPVYLMLRYLGEGVRGHRIAYEHCPADADNQSLVSICGMLLE